MYFVFFTVKVEIYDFMKGIYNVMSVLISIFIIGLKVAIFLITKQEVKFIRYPP